MTAIPAIPGIPATRVDQLQQLWAGQPRLEAVWLFGSRAMDRHGPGSDIDLCLEGPALSHSDRLALMAAVRAQPVSTTQEARIKPARSG